LRMLEAQTLPETYRLLYNLGTASQDLSDLASQIKQNPSVLIRGVSQPPLGPGERNGQ